MADDELKKLKRPELLNLLLETMSENEKLKAELSETRAQLADRQLDVLEAGSIAEASLKLNSVFEAAQLAADQYLDNIERLYRGRGELVREAQSKAQALVAQAKLDAQGEVEQVRIDADVEAEQIRAAAKVAADEARAQARQAKEEADEARRATIRAKQEAADLLQEAQSAAQALIEQAQSEATEKAERIESEAQRKADELVADARAQAQSRMDEAERVSRNFEMATKVKCDNTMRRALDEAHTYGNTMRMALHALGITPEIAHALEEGGDDEESEQAREEAVSELDEAVNTARAAVAAAISNAKTPPGTLDDESVAAMYPASAEQL